jgi:Tfp pilus assembly protein PilN
MRAVNLIPTEQQRGAGGAAGRSGGGAYILLGTLAVLVVMAGLYVTSGKSVSDKKAELAHVTQQAQQAEAKAQSLQSYTKFSSLRQKRVETVSQLAAARFDWSHSLREVARVLPTNAWLISLTGTTSPTVNVGSSGGGSLRGAIAAPAIEIQGCTTSQASVAKLMARMRLIDGVQRVSLEDSAKGAPAQKTSGAAPASDGGSNTSDCRGGSGHFPQFKAVVFFEPSAAALPATGTTPTAGTTASSTTPASTTTAAGAPAASSSTPSTTSSAASGGVTP